jgi:hypothetical protein
MCRRHFACDVGQITGTSSRVPYLSRGAFRDRHLTLARDAVDARCAADESACRGRRSRGVLISRRWYQVGGMIRRRWWQESPITRETTKETVTPSCRECRSEPGEPVVTTLVCFFVLHTRPRVHRAPGIPCALCLFEGRSFAKPASPCVAGGRRCVRKKRRHSGARVSASPESIPP